MSLDSELVPLAQLKAYLSDDQQYTRHEYWSSRPGQSGLRKQQWMRTKCLGRGGFGEVHQEECISGDGIGDVRAVKAVRKPSSKNRKSIDYNQELEAIARFSQEGVLKTPHLLQVYR